MDLQEAFLVLGIEQTKDKHQLKNAYRTLLTKNNPEDHPEEFKRLRQAYELAVQYADSTEEEKKQEEVDDSPSGRVAVEFRDIYEHISRRSNPEEFKRFFEQEIFLSLDQDELCREKILVFMMSHYYFPTEVWKLLDKYLRISAGEKELREKFPPDYINFLLVKCTNGEEVNFAQFEGADDAAYDEYIHYSEKIYQALRQDKVDEAEQYLEAADKMGIYNPVMELARSGIRKKQGRTQEGLSVLKNLHERFPEDEIIGYNYAEALWSEEQRDEAVKLYQQLKEKNDDHYMANIRLTQWYYECGEYETAKKHAYCVIKFGCDDAFRDLLHKINDQLEIKYTAQIEQTNSARDKMELVWCYLQSEKLLKALRLAEAIKDEVADCDRTEYIGMLAKIYVECGMYDKVEEQARAWLTALDKERPDEYERKVNTGHYLIAEALQFLACKNEKLYAQAESELADLGDKLAKEYSLLIKLACIYADEGKVKECTKIAEYLEKHRIYVGHSICLDAYEHNRDANGIIEQSKKVVQYIPQMERAYELAARVFYQYGALAGLKDVLELAEKNQVTSDILEAYKYLSTLEEKPDASNLEQDIKDLRASQIHMFQRTGEVPYYVAALQKLNEYLKQFPGGYLLVERGLLYLSAQKYREAAKDFLKALEDDPYNQYAWNNLGCVHLEEGNYDKAFVCFQKSICAAGGEYLLPYQNIADCYDAVLDYEKEEEQYETIKKRFSRKDNDYYSPLLAVYTNLGKVDAAKKLISGNRKNASPLYYSDLLSLYIETNHMKLAGKIVVQWSSGVFVNRISRDLSFYRQTAWYYLMTGKYRVAMHQMKQAIKTLKEQNKDYFEVYEETLFMLYLGNELNEKCLSKAKEYVNQLDKLSQKNELFVSSKKYRKYLYVLTAIFGGQRQKAEKLLENMGQCPRCIGCTRAVCKEYQIARAMLLEWDGQKEEAQKIFADLFRDYPHDKYIMALKRYKLGKG